MRHRGKPVQCRRVFDKSRQTWVWRVTGSLPGRGQKSTKFPDDKEQEAWELRDQWEQLRLRGAAALQPKITHLTLPHLRQAEAAMALLEGENTTLIDVVKYFLTNRPHVAPVVTFGAALGKFLADKKPHLSQAQYDNYRIRGVNFEEFVGTTTKLSAITSAHVESWLRTRRTGDEPISRKTWNNYRNDLSAVFVWCKAKPRQWLKENPVDPIAKFSKKSLKPQARQRLDLETCRHLMQTLETAHPEWCCFFALALFMGIRPDMTNGEVRELATCVERDGPERYFSNGYLHLSAEITKEGESRQTAIPENVAAWLERYPPTPSRICPGDYKAYTQIRKKFQIPHDGLRHTAISNFVAQKQTLAGAALQFGNSESIIRRHYLSRVSQLDAEEFYRICPSAKSGPS